MKLQGRELKIRMKGEDVALLQKELLQLGYQIPDEEQSRKNFGQPTQQAVLDFQNKYGLEPNGVVDAETAKAINDHLERMPTKVMAAPYVVWGHVRNEAGNPIAGLTIRAVDKDVRGENILGNTISNQDGSYEIKYSAGDFRRSKKERGGPDLIVSVLKPDGTLASSSPRIENAGRSERVDLVVQADPGRGDPSKDVYLVDGVVSSPDRPGVGGLRVQVVDKNIGQDVLLGESVTDPRGRYSLQLNASSLHERGKQQPDLQARAYAGQTFLGASDVHYNASKHETLNIFLSEKASSTMQSEYETLTGAISAHFNGRPGDLQESDVRQDITYLANKTGWDARAVALAALADQFSARTTNAKAGAGIEPAFFYALFRAGLPANEDALYHADAGTLTGVWNKAVEQGVIPKQLASKIPQVVQQFQVLSAQKLLTGPAVAGVSPLKDMLAASRLDQNQQARFAEIYAAQRADLTAFWTAVGDAFGPATANRLQLDGKLGFLTVNNAPLIQALHNTAGKNDITDPVQLAQMGYHRASRWGSVLTANIPVPNEIPGDTAEAKRANYAEYLAAQVRLSYPTASIAEMISSGDLPLPGAAQGIADQVHAFLTKNQGKFEIGMQPVQQYIAKNNMEVPDQVVTQVKRVQRVYQITAGDQAMIGLLKRGIDAAYQVVHYQKDAFVNTFAQDLGGPDQAALTYDKSVQVHNAVLNVALSYLTARTAPAIGVHSPAGILDPAPTAANAGDILAYGTLESLFGSMDFCECEHCRSVLSPAAYLVDLLQFIDIDPTTLPKGTENPQTVLLERRPDVQYLPLTCENTNTALPYIDVVNETLEYFIANSTQTLSLQDYVGHDTAGLASEDLLASPQFVMDSAYAVLLNERFPVPLPFHQPLENLRRYFNKFQVSLPLAMERLCKSASLERGGNPYGWRDILMEELLLSREEYEILTDSAVVPLWRMYGFPNGTADPVVIAALSNAKQYTRRVGITYEDIVAILETRFVNPNSDLIPKLERLGVPFATLKTLKDGTLSDSDFDALLPTGTNAPDPAEYGGDIKAWVKNNDNYARIMALITLTDPTGNTDSCSFDTLEFRYATPMANASDTSTRLGATEFVRLSRFIRLWKKTGWSIEQTDAAICALFPVPLFPQGADAINTVAKLDAGFLSLLPTLGIVVRVMNTLQLTPKRDLLGLLACWSLLGTYGDNSLYRRMFLNPALLKQDSAFADNGYGEFLVNNAEKLADHAVALRSAFNLTADEYDRIATALGYDANTPLTIANISAIYRRGWLARKLKLSVRELLLLMQFTGLDPFTLSDPTGPAVLQIIALVQALKDRSLKSAAALYLIWNQDLSGKSSPDPTQVTELARTLRADFVGIEDQFAAVEDPSGDIARARMALVYGQETADSFFALLDDTIVLDVSYTNPTPKLDAAITAADPNIAYDDFHKRLSYTGLLTATQQNTLKTVPGVTPAFQKAVDALYSQSEDAKGSFFTRYPELKPLYDTYVLSMDPPAVKRTALLAAFQPQLSKLRKRQQAQQRLSAAAGVDLDFTQALLDPAVAPGAPYPLHAIGHTDRPALNDVLALETPGLQAQFFYRNTATGAVDLSLPAEAQLDYAPLSSSSLPANPTPGNPISGIWSGQVEMPEAGYYNFVIETDTGASVTLSLDGQVQPLTQNGSIWRNTDPLELKAGTLYDLALTVEKVKDVLSFKWETPKRPREVIPARYLYPPTILPLFSDTYIRFLKVGSLAKGLNLTANETAYFAIQPDYQISGDGWLNALPVRGDPGTPTAVALLKPFQALLDSARIKAAVSPSDEQLLTALEDPAAATANADSLLYKLTRWEPASLTALLNQFGKVAADLAHMETFRRVYDAFALVRQMGISGEALIRVTTNEPTGDTVRDLQAALRARYDSTDWRSVVQPINDEMRGLQRNALVEYILHQMRINPATAHIDTADKLFEYFLMDVEMEPCMQTSRIRHALSSVQLFIERCLMNLEPRVSPLSINAQQWEWMKRYRVWEANRKVFLFPENWLEPELRDDKSPFFKEVESELLQSDITEDSATTALLNYLAKLEEVAKLEPCGIYHVEGDPGKRTGDVDHVIARTPGTQRKYYYRRYEYGYWTPWEQIKLDIEDNPVMPVVWNGRLLLFWLRILKQAPLDAQTPGTGDANLTTLKKSDINAVAVRSTIQVVLCWSEYYNGKWQATKTSDIQHPATLGSFSENPQGYRFDRYERPIWVMQDLNDDTLWVCVGNYPDSNMVFHFYNTHSLPEMNDPFALPGADWNQDILCRIDYRLMDTGLAADNPGAFVVQYYAGYIEYSQQGPGYDSDLSRKLLQNTNRFRLIEPNHAANLKKPFEAPFFFEDRRHVFFVTTSEAQVFIPNYPDYGIMVDPNFKAVVGIPPLVFQIDPNLKQESKPVGGPIGPDPGITDTVPMQQFVTEDAYIRQAIGTTASVTYNGRQIGPSGATSNVAPGM